MAALTAAQKADSKAVQ
jgi:hypothetical protein